MMRKSVLIFFMGLSILGCKKTHLQSDTIDVPGKAGVDNVPYSDTNPLLKNANDEVVIGAAVNAGKFSNTAYAALAGNQYNSLTAENEMKFKSLEPTRGNFTYNTAVVQFAQSHGINRVHGHNLIWWSSNPTWLSSATTPGLTDDETYRSVMQNHITSVITYYYQHYKASDGSPLVKSWDVVNEAVNNNGTLRGSGQADPNDADDTAKDHCIWLDKISGEGYTYIKLAFQYARQAAVNAGDTNLKLFYNDYGQEYSKTKANAIAALVTRLYNEPLIGGQHIIDGVGLQMHTNYARKTDDTDSQASIEYAITKMKQTGLKVHIAELDISVKDRNDGTTAADRVGAQQYRYFYIPQQYRNIVPANQRWGITLWNIGDADSSLGTDAAATLYNIDYSRKYSYQRFYEGLNQAITIQ